MALCYCSQAWYHARLREKTTLVMHHGFPVEACLKFSRSLLCQGSTQPDLHTRKQPWDKLGEAREKGREFKLNGQLTCLWSIPLAQPSVQVFSGQNRSTGMTEVSSQVVSGSIYGQEAGVCQVNQGCVEKQQWKNKLLLRMSPTAPVLLESDFGGALRLCTHSINQKMAPLLPCCYFIFFYIFQIPFPTDTLIF